jgi:YVTN family beta-propeller protein
VYVANYGSDSVSVINSSSNTILQTISGITTANGIVHDWTNNIIWVTNYSSDQVTPIQADAGATNFTVLSPISVGDGPWGVAYDQAHNYVYVVNNLGNSVTVINAGTQTVVTTLGGFSQPYHVAANPVTGKVYVTNFGNHTVTVLNGTAVSSVINLNVGDPSTQPYGIAVDEIREVIYVATVDSHRVVAIGVKEIDGTPVPDQLLGWAEFHRGYFSPPPDQIPVPMRAIAINPDMPPFAPGMDDGGHVWTTTSTSDSSEADQALLIPKGWISDFHSPIPCNVRINPSEGIAIDRYLDRAYVTSGTNPGRLAVITDPTQPPLVAFSTDESGNDDGFTFEVYTVE